MKKITAILAILVAFATTTNAQFKWGLEGGMNLSKMKVSGDGGMFGSDNRTGWFIGPKAQFTIPVVGLGVDGAILYSQKYMKMEYTTTNDLGEQEVYPGRNKSLPYIEIPVNLKYNIGFSSILGMYISTGPQWSWYLGSRNLSFEGVSLGSLERSSFSWNVGLGITALDHLQVGLTYNIALGETGQIKKAADAFETFDMKNNTFQVRLAYLF